MELFFAALIVLSTVCIGLLSLFYKKLPFVAVLAIVAISALYLGFYIQLFFFCILALTLYKRLSFITLAIFCMLSSIVLAYFFLNLFSSWVFSEMVLISFFAVCLICALGILGIFEENIRSYLVISNFIQLTFVVLDLSIANLAGKMGVLTVIQIFNYVIAGTLLFTTIGLFSGLFKKEKFEELGGSYNSSPFNAFCAIVAALSLAGIPALNIFVAEWYLFIVSFAVNPAITILGIFAALVLFVMYFKIAYVMLINKKTRKIDVPVGISFVNGVLSALCILLGIFPYLQSLILEWFL